KAENSWKFDEARLKGSAFEKAEFWYSVRQYENALKLYEQVIASYDPKKHSVYELDTALSRTASILVRVYLDLDRAQIFFTKYAAIQKLPTNIRQKLRVWADTSERFAASPAAKKSNRSLEHVIKMAGEFFSE